MKKNFVAFVLFLLMFGAIPISCDILCLDSCGCGNNVPPKDFSIKDFEVKDFLMGQTFNPDFYYPKDDLYKLIEVSDFEFLSQTGHSILGAGFIQIAKACSPAPNESKESITGIMITTKKQFGVSPEKNIEIGSDISGYFLISNYPSNLAETISDYLNIKPKIYLGDGLFLKWNSSLVENLELVFDLKIELSNGKVFVFEDEKMKLLK
ncbi:hypothetical protein MMU07_02220 [Aquiflexum sp. LQ15W]|uniref:hypothetical protein n=1 Tax=Cognataquiflexum nitidum TaxID=2922272 RepID=UPI001F13A966|nr:hypothetical protein [Cognataquiflexum nitidum]MCH6198378.1 hypothetical protein [Cognataquiflexum nitidum]